MRLNFLPKKIKKILCLIVVLQLECSMNTPAAGKKATQAHQNFFGIFLEGDIVDTDSEY